MRRTTISLVLAASLLARPVLAQDATEQAKTLFNAGAQAYEVGKYAAAIQAFSEAYRLSKRAGIVFSIAQAYRRQYTADRNPANLRAAVQHYRDYIAKVEQGGRRAEAVQALSELEPMLERLGAAAGPAAPTPAAQKAPTQLMVSVQTKEATISLDGGKPVEAPLIAEVKPGKHRVEVTAPGYFPEAREVQAAEGSTVALDIPLRDRPGQLTLVARDGADVSVDGRLVASTPLARPIEVAPGRHLVAVVKRGHRPFSEDVDFGRGEQKKLDAKLEVTGQRVGAYVLVGVGAAAAVGGGVLAGLAVLEQRKAQDLDQQRTSVGITQANRDAYDAAKARRDDYRRWAGVALGGAVVVGTAAALLAVFDLPSLSAGPRRDQGPKPATPSPGERSMEMAAAPMVGPGVYGLAVTGRF